VTGFVFASSVNFATGTDTLSLSNFTLIGMSGMMSGILHAPLTAIFLIAEITSGYTLFVPLMLVSAIAYTTAQYFESHSLYAKHLALSGDLIPEDKDKRVLQEMTIEQVIETDLLKIAPEATLGELVSLVRKSKRNLFPVVNVKGELVGILTLDDIREIMFDHERYDEIYVNSLMHTPPAHVGPHENMQSVMEKFEATGAWNLPVLESGRYVGFLSKSRIFNTYRYKLRRQHIS
jgi:CIC family chloride channel protein